MGAREKAQLVKCSVCKHKDLCLKKKKKNYVGVGDVAQW